MKFVRLIPTLFFSAITGFIVLMVSSFFFGRMFEGFKPLDVFVGLGLPLVLTALTVRATFLIGLRRVRDIEIQREVRFRVRGQCARCGYSLTGNVSGVCPECGTVVTSAPEPPVR